MTILAVEVNCYGTDKSALRSDILFSGYLFRGDNQIVIRGGISSVAPVRAVHDMLENINSGIPHYSNTGFYIRLNASLSSSDSVLLTYASYKMSPGEFKGQGHLRSRSLEVRVIFIRDLYIFISILRVEREKGLSASLLIYT